MLAQCAVHLRQYNDALLINDTLRMMDAYSSLEKFYNTKSNEAIDGTDIFLVGLFQGGDTDIFITSIDMFISTIVIFGVGNNAIFSKYYCLCCTENQVELKNLAKDSRYENPKMAKLESVLLEQFGSGVKSRGILFSKTRQSTRCLNNWVLENRALQEAGIKAAILTGAGNGITHMTQV